MPQQRKPELCFVCGGAWPGCKCDDRAFDEGTNIEGSKFEREMQANKEADRVDRERQRYQR